MGRGFLMPRRRKPNRSARRVRKLLARGGLYDFANDRLIVAGAKPVNFFEAEDLGLPILALTTPPLELLRENFEGG